MSHAVAKSSLHHQTRFPKDIPFLVDEYKKQPLHWQRTGSDHEFPVLRDRKILKLLGRKGQLFGSEIQYKLYWNEKKQILGGGVYFNDFCEGPPRRVHGGCIATAFDIVLSWISIRVLGFGVVTLNLNVNYKRFIPLNSVVHVQAWIEKIEGRKVFVKAQFTNAYELDRDDENDEESENDESSENGKSEKVERKVTTVNSPTDLKDINSNEKKVIHAEASAVFFQVDPHAKTYEQMFQLFGGRKGIKRKGMLLKQLRERVNQQIGGQQKPAKQVSLNETLSNTPSMIMTHNPVFGKMNCQNSYEYMLQSKL